MTTYSQLPLVYKNTFSSNIDFLRVIGIEFFDESTGFTVRHLRFIFFLVTFLPFAFVQFALISEINSENLFESVRVLPNDLFIAIDIVKIWIAIFKRKVVRDMLLEIGDLWPKVQDLSEEKNLIIKDWLRPINSPANLYLKFGSINVVIFELVAIFITIFNLFRGVVMYIVPYKTLWNVDSFLIYVLTYLYEIFGSAPCIIFLYLPFDSLMVNMTSNISLLLRLLQVDLTGAVNMYDDNNQTDSYRKLKEIVVVHQKLLRLVEQLNEVFGIVFFFHVAVASLIICFYGFLTVVYGGVLETCINLLTGITGAFTVFLLSRAGQLLCDSSSEVADAAYATAWYERDARVKKLLLIIIIRAQRPSYLSALGFMDITLRSFSGIMSSAWTYFSLLIQIYGDN